MSALAHQRNPHLNAQRQPHIGESWSQREERHLRLIWSKPEPLARHIYQRRRVVALVLFAFLSVAVWQGTTAGINWYSADTGASSAAVATATPASQTTWTVSQGDTLWSIATAVSGPGKDVRPLVSELSKARNGAPLQLGEKIAITP